MLERHTLRGRLTLAYASALAVALIAFALLALAVLDTAQRSALDAQLATTARALLAVADVRNGDVTMEEVDRGQFSAITGAKASAAILHPDGNVLLASGYAVPPPIRRAAMGANGSRYADATVGGDAVRAYVLPIVAGGTKAGTIVVWRDAEAIAALDRSVALAFAFAIPVAVALAVLFGSAIARRGLAPLAHIATVAAEIEGHDLSQRLALPPRDDELGRFAAAFDRMLDRLQHAFERERRFTSDASHELRAPLSVIRAEADLALRKERDPAEYRRALEGIAAEADALEALTRDLLAAARAESKFPSAGDAVVDLAALAASATSRLGILAEARGLALRTAGEPNALVQADHDALARALVTVLHNAIKYARAGVAVRVARRDDAVVVEVEDDGTGFSPVALDRAFDRFWRDDEARSTEGSGLGLAIARTLVEGSGGTIALSNRAGGGARVAMTFAAASRDGAPGV
ncbi:MAG: HAMP domain-containing protein [Candidatus Eremiobacteraeota bacterium]|nr:HAMP domain-containing protein [Candidatus Eremiobacteraeota bacterium]MBC5804050.1 HAMP domain-containing protein [Candidatus Eremiobacteraeota bacterium]MBC5822235.1 HAMP domain-containing protein [Candidatus Eremiobacteraeota bacterium]